VIPQYMSTRFPSALGKFQIRNFEESALHLEHLGFVCMFSSLVLVFLSLACVMLLSVAF
jgi:hypothetical protein